MPRSVNGEAPVIIEIDPEASSRTLGSEASDQTRFSKKNDGSLGTHLRNFKGGQTGKIRQLSPVQKEAVSLYIDSADSKADAINFSKKALEHVDVEIKFEDHFDVDGKPTLNKGDEKSTLKTKIGNALNFVPKALNTLSWAAGAGMSIKLLDIVLSTLNPTPNQTQNTALGSLSINNAGLIANNAFGLPNPGNISIPSLPSPNNTNSTDPSDTLTGLVPNLSDFIKGTPTGTALAAVGGVVAAAVVVGKYWNDSKKEQKKEQNEQTKQAIAMSHDFENIVQHVAQKPSGKSSSIETPPAKTPHRRKG